MERDARTAMVARGKPDEAQKHESHKVNHTVGRVVSRREAVAMGILGATSLLLPGCDDPTGVTPSLRFRLIADTNTTIPGGSGTFKGLSMFHSADRDSIAFCGANTAGQLGVYSFVDQGLRVVADATTPVPGGSGTFTNITPFEDISGSDVIFIGFDTIGFGGLFRSRGGQLSELVTTRTPIPGGTGNFTNFVKSSLSGANVAINGFGSGGQQGIYAILDGQLGTLADKGTSIPGGTGTFTAFASFSGPAISGRNVAFEGFGAPGKNGIYANIGGGLTKVVASGDTIEGKVVDRVGFSPEGLDGDEMVVTVVFVDNTWSVFRVRDGRFALVVDTRMPMPGGVGNFTRIHGIGPGPSLQDGSVAFIADGASDQRGVFLQNPRLGEGILLVANRTTRIPFAGAAGNFTDFGPPTAIGGGLFQRAPLDVGGYQALYAAEFI